MNKFLVETIKSSGSNFDTKGYIKTITQYNTDDLSTEISNRISQDNLKLDLTGGIMSGSIVSNSFIKKGGTANQYLMADGSISTTSASGQPNIYFYQSDRTDSLSTGFLRIDYNDLSRLVLIFSVHTTENINIEVFLSMITKNSIIYIQNRNDANIYKKFNCIEPPFLVTGNCIRVPCTIIESPQPGVNFDDNELLFMSVFSDLEEIDTKINLLSSQISQESNDRLNADNILYGEIQAEITTRSNQNTLLTTNLNTEINTRSNQNTLLTTNINTNLTAQNLIGTNLTTEINTRTSQNALKLNLTGGNLSGVLNTQNLLPSTSLVSNIGSSSYLYNNVNTNNVNTNNINTALYIPIMTSNNLPLGYIASSTGAYQVVTEAYCAFNGTSNTYFQSTLNKYDNNTGVYNYGESTLNVDVGAYIGDWLQIKLPYAITIDSFTISNQNGGNTRSPSSFLISYSQDGIIWNSCNNTINFQWVNVEYTFPTNNIITAMYFRITVSLVGNISASSLRNCFNINEWVLNQVQTIVNVPSLISYKSTFSDPNELITKSYVDSNFQAVSIAQSDATYLSYALYFTTSAIITNTTGYFPSGGMINIGATTTAVAQASTNSFTKIFKCNNPVSSVSNGAKSGYIATAAFPKIYIGSGFIWNMNFGIGDTNTSITSICQMLCGFTILTTAPVFNLTTGPNTALNILGIGCDLGDSVLSFYSRGASGGSVKTPTVFSCATPSTLWFNLTIYNPNNSNTMYLILTEQISNISASINYVCNTSTSILNTSLLYPIYTRGMATAGGITGSAQCYVNKFQLLLK